MRAPRSNAARALRAVAPLLAFALACAERPWHGILLDPPSAAPPLAVARGDGSRFTLASARGAVTVVYFGYTFCPDVCPTMMADWTRARRALGADTARVRFVFVSVDPGRDSPAIAQGYARQYDAAFEGYATTDAELALILRDWGIAAYPEGDPRTPNYTVAHPAHAYVVDAAGRLRLMIPPGVRGEQIAEDLRRLR
ncbi:MAG: SCO family protein [Gemmatimonadaceae bacterium]|nr:SCO family protein [Gemmatimonadaceae bacterium]